MAYDSFLTAAVAGELDLLLRGRSVTGVELVFGGDLLLSLGPRREPVAVVLALDPFPAVYGRTELLSGSPAEGDLWPRPPAGLDHFARILEARLAGRAVTGVKHLDWERTLEVAFTARTGLRGSRGRAWLVHQAAPKPARVFLLEPDRTVAAVWPAGRDAGPAKGEAFVPPPFPRRLKPSELAADREAFAAALSEVRHGGGASDDPVKLVLAAAPALGPTAAREIGRRAVSAGEGDDALYDSFRTLVSLYPEGPFTPGIIARERRPEVPVEVTAVPVQPDPGLVFRPTSCAGCALAEWHERIRSRTVLQERAAHIRRGLKKALARADRKVRRRTDEQTPAHEAAGYRLKGELLLANLHQVRPGDDKITVADYDGRPLTITLDPRLGPSENAQRWFARYRKAERAARKADLVRKAENELAWLESLRYDLEAVAGPGDGPDDVAEALAELAEIERTLVWAGHLPRPVASGVRRRDDRGDAGRRRRGPGARPPLRYVTDDGLTVLAARSARQNEVLSLKTAGPDDLWFHVRGRPGSHVVLRLPPGDVSDPPVRSLHQAAAVAVHLSAARGGGKVEVDYTRARHLRRPRGAPPGLVLYDPHQTLLVDTDKVPLPAEVGEDARSGTMTEDCGTTS